MSSVEGDLIWEDPAGGRLYQGCRRAFGYLPLHGIESVALLAHEFQPTLAGYDVLRAPFRDCGSFVPQEAAEVAGIARGAAEWAARRVREGRRVLVSCFSGLNRSGLVAALALAELTDFDGQALVARVRERRSPHALNNALFERWVLERRPK